jgi:hypothetical protein
MYNADLPTRAELPTAKQLVRSTLIALAAAIVILVTAVLPGEYGIDPTGIGRVLGLTQMGEIKMQLAEEAAADRAAPRLEEPADAPQGDVAAIEPAPASADLGDGARTDEISVTLRPGQGAEVKLTMETGRRVQFEWNVEGGVANYDLHGDGGGNQISYQQGRGVPGHSGEFEAAFDGSHGWFWRNRGTSDVTITLRTRGAYTDIRRVL